MNLRFIFWFDDFTLQVEMSGVLKRGMPHRQAKHVGRKRRSKRRTGSGNSKTTLFKDEDQK